MKKFISIAALTTFLMLFVNGSLSAAECEGPSLPVKIFVEHVEGTTVYKYTIRNQSAFKIRRIYFGRREGDIFNLSVNIPSDIRSPEGWIGNHGFEYEGPHIVIKWKPMDKIQEIKPDQDLGGFEIEMDIADPELEKVSFRVHAGPWCYWGIVEKKN